MPNFLLDEVMPTLSDTQWRLLCVIVRQTLGWQVEAKSGQPNRNRKEWDWLSHAQLKRRTGRHSAALCQAIEELMQQNLIEVQDGQGRSLATPQERRRAHSQLFYRLHPRLKQDSVRETRNTERKRDISQSEFRKAKTTKENQTKEFRNNNLLLSLESEKPLPVNSQNREKGGDGGNLSPHQDGESATDSFIKRYQEFYQQYRPGQSVPLISVADKELLQRRIEQHSTETLEKWLPLFFGSRFGYVCRRDYSLESFLNSLHVLQADRRRPIN